MAFFAQFRNVSENAKSKAVQKLITDSTPDYDFFLMVILSILMATFGLWIDSPAVVIGSMLIAPILYPILSLSLGMVMSDYKLMARSLYTMLKSFAFGIAAAMLATFFFASGYETLTNEILLRAEPSLLYFAVAVVAGIAVSVALVRPEISESLPGVAISVALIPPLAVIGVGIAKLEWGVVSGSVVLLLVNVVGIVFASMVSFSLLNLYVKRKVAQTTIKKEEVRVEKEKEKAEEIQKKDGI